MAQVATYVLKHSVALPPNMYSIFGDDGDKANSLVCMSVSGGSHVSGGIPCDFSTDLSFVSAGFVTTPPGAFKKVEVIPMGTSFAASAVKFRVTSLAVSQTAGTTVSPFIVWLIGSGPMASAIA